MTAKTKEIIESSMDASEAAWDGAIEGAEREGGDNRADRAYEAAETCRESYSTALAALDAADLLGARVALDAAWALEAEWGDDQHARAALVALDAAIARARVRRVRK